MQDAITTINQQRPNHQPNGGGSNVRDSERVASAVAGGALALYGLSDARDRLPALLAGGYLLFRGISGHCTIYQSLGINTETGETRPAHIDHTITIAAGQSELYRLWRDFSNLPRFMDHLERVEVIDRTHSHWVARGPADTQVAWDAEIFLERENELIAWRSAPDAQIVNAGSVRFTPAPGGRGTEVRVVMEYMPPAGAIGRAAARLFGEEPGQQVIDDLRRLKMIIESGEVATNATRPQTAQEVA